MIIVAQWLSSRSPRARVSRINSLKVTPIHLFCSTPDKLLISPSFALFILEKFFFTALNVFKAYAIRI